MSVKPFVSCDHPAISQPATRVTNIHNPLVQQTITDLKDTLTALQQQGHGVGLAAVQIGIPLAIFAISIPDTRAQQQQMSAGYPLTIYLNPSYQSINNQVVKGREGCFSFPGLMSERVNRYQAIQFTAMTENGKLIEFKAENFLARVLQHETDHCDGHAYLQRLDTPLAELSQWATHRPTLPLAPDLELTNTPETLNWPALISWLNNSHDLN